MPTFGSGHAETTNWSVFRGERLINFVWTNGTVPATIFVVRADVEWEEMDNGKNTEYQLNTITLEVCWLCMNLSPQIRVCCKINSFCTPESTTKPNNSPAIASDPSPRDPPLSHRGATRVECVGDGDERPQTWGLELGHDSDSRYRLKQLERLGTYPPVESSSISNIFNYHSARNCRL